MSNEQPEQVDPIDVRNNPESRAAAADAITRVARASGGGAPPRVAPDAGEMPEERGGTADGDPLAGLLISDDDRAEAVSGDTGPTGHEGPSVGHA